MKFIFKIAMIICLTIISGCFHRVSGQRPISLEILPGGSIAFPSPLYVFQNGYPSLNFTARYRTESFHLPVYYSLRLGHKINKKSAVELEMNHLKIILDNNPPEIEEFVITHGYNQLWVNYTRLISNFNFRAGLGAVIANPGNTIRGKRLNQSGGIAKRGYYLCGITSQLSVQKKFYLCKNLFITAETKINAAYAQVKIVDGIARVPQYSLHGLIGFGVSF